MRYWRVVTCLCEAVLRCKRLHAKETKGKTMEEPISVILPRLGSGLFVLLLHLLTTLALLALGVLCYMGVTPFRERALIATGNTAAGLVLAGTLIALAIPLAA